MSGNQVRTLPTGGIMGSGWGAQSCGCGIGNSGGGGSSLSPTPFSEYGEVSAVAAGAEVIVVQYAIAIGGVFMLTRVEFAGTNIGRYQLWFDNNLEQTTWTWFNGPMFGSWDFAIPVLGGIPVPGGTVIKVKAMHNRPYVGDFTARIQGIVFI